ncbi:metallophosphoesterase [Sorangium sp. So ce1128]
MTPDDPLEIAVLGDVHGHLTLVYQLLRRWQRETGRALDLILQVGDLGAFPPPFRLDRATKRFAESDPDELGFAAYHDGSPEADAILGPDVPPDQRISADLVFIRGNHEDFEFLAEAGAGYDAPVPVDAYDKILYLRPHRLNPGCIGVLRWAGPDESAFAFVDAPWLDEYTRSNYRTL